jgi:hypothetical protein
MNDNRNWKTFFSEAEGGLQSEAINIEQLAHPSRSADEENLLNLPNGEEHSKLEQRGT